MLNIPDNAWPIVDALLLAYLEVQAAAFRQPEEMFDPRVGRGKVEAVLAQCGGWDETARRSGYPDIRDELGDVIVSRLEAITIAFPAAVRAAFKRRLRGDRS